MQNIAIKLVQVKLLEIDLDMLFLVRSQYILKFRAALIRHLLVVLSMTQLPAIMQWEEQWCLSMVAHMVHCQCLRTLWGLIQIL
nr:MAG TPA: hypothetical protein [Caudoviricetes sp.]